METINISKVEAQWLSKENFTGNENYISVKPNGTVTLHLPSPD
jgi:hypothetical protein